MTTIMHVPCHNYNAHAAHYFSGDRICSGLTPGESGAIRLIRELDELLRPYAAGLFGVPSRFERPSGLCVICHPAVPNMLRRVIAPTYSEHLNPDRELLQVPLVVSVGMAYGEWRIELASGTIPLKTKEPSPPDSVPPTTQPDLP